MNILIVTMSAVITFCATSVVLDLRRGEKIAAVRDAVTLVLVVILCMFVLIDTHEKAQTYAGEAPQSHVDETSRAHIAQSRVDETSQVRIDDASIPETLNGGEPKSDEKPRIAKDTPLSKPKDPTAGADVGKNIDPAPDTDTNNGIGAAYSTH